MEDPLGLLPSIMEFTYKRAESVLSYMFDEIVICAFFGEYIYAGRTDDVPAVNNS